MAVDDLRLDGPETLRAVPENQETYRYQDDRWSIREVIGHLVDTERLFSYRALSMARADPAELPGIDQDQWAVASNANERTLASLLEDFASVRASSVALFESFTGDIWDRRGKASGCEFTVRAFPYILAGHEIHHRRVLEELYLAPLRAQGS